MEYVKNHKYLGFDFEKRNLNFAHYLKKLRKRLKLRCTVIGPTRRWAAGEHQQNDFSADHSPPFRLRGAEMEKALVSFFKNILYLGSYFDYPNPKKTK